MRSVSATRVSEFDELLGPVRLPRVALVEQQIDSPPAVTDIRRGVRDALGEVELPQGSVAIGVGSRGVGRVGEVVAALVAALKEAGARPFVVPAMGSHGASTAEGQAQVLRHLGVSEERIGCPIRATMETVKLGQTPSGVEVYMDRNAYEADAVVVVNRIKPHTAFRGAVESGPMKMIAIGLGKQQGAHSIHITGWDRIHTTIPEAAEISISEGNVSFGLALLENDEEEPYRIKAIQADRLRAEEPALLEEAKRKLPRLPFEEIDVLVVDEIGKNVSGDGADPNVTGRYPTPYASGGPAIERMVFLGLTEETAGNANGMGLADIVTERLASEVDRTSTYTNALTSAVSKCVRLPMVMPDDRLAVAAALEMTVGVKPAESRLVRIENTLKLRRMWVSEALLQTARERGLTVLEEPRELEFDENRRLTPAYGSTT